MFEDFRYWNHALDEYEIYYLYTGNWPRPKGFLKLCRYYLDKFLLQRKKGKRPKY